MTLPVFSFTQKPGQAGAVTESRPMADSGALPASRAFAERLQQQLQAPPSPEVPHAVPHAAPRPAVHQEPVSSSQDRTPDEPDAATRQARRGPMPQRPRAPAAQRPAEAQPADRAAAEAKAAAPAATEADTDTAGGGGAAPAPRPDAGTDTCTPLSWMLQWVAGKPLPDAAAAGGSMLSRGGAGDTALGRAGKGHAGAGRLMPDDATGQAAGSAPAGSREAWQAALDTQAVRPDHALAHEHALAAASGTPAAAAWAPVAGAAGQGDAPAPVQVSLDTPVNRPEFRDELAAQVSSFAHDGIQEAVLNLNPAEMGPITVQIVLDGTQATVDFQAVQPATRELIEASLPALASALHGEGLTLSGGSVGDQRRPSQGDPQAHGGRRGGADGDAGGIRMAPGHAAARRADGVLDLYA